MAAVLKAVCGPGMRLRAQGPSPTCLDEHSSLPLPLLPAMPVSPPASLDAAGTLLQHLGTPAFQELQLGEGHPLRSVAHPPPILRRAQPVLLRVHSCFCDLCSSEASLPWSPS